MKLRSNGVEVRSNGRKVRSNGRKVRSNGTRIRSNGMQVAIRLHFCPECPSIAVLLFLCTDCSSISTVPTGPLYLMLPCAYCSSVPLYPLFLRFSVPTVPLFHCTHCPCVSIAGTIPPFVRAYCFCELMVNYLRVRYIRDFDYREYWFQSRIHFKYFVCQSRLYGHCKLKVLLQIKNCTCTLKIFTCKLNIVHAN